MVASCQLPFASCQLSVCPPIEGKCIKFCVARHSSHCFALNTFRSWCKWNLPLYNHITWSHSSLRHLFNNCWIFFRRSSVGKTSQNYGMIGNNTYVYKERINSTFTYRKYLTLDARETSKQKKESESNQNSVHKHSIDFLETKCGHEMELKPVFFCTRFLEIFFRVMLCVL